ncbi:conserved hypothetical protein [Ricinus communis]|uniref:Sulfotransferase n=1 Tax=Ricinus communis TaxID=3988 RepID=B9RZU3_RICCO|nr:conserved hypothetical protein [Ricinus communis]
MDSPRRKAEEGGGGEPALALTLINKHKRIISTLPKRNCWETTTKAFCTTWLKALAFAILTRSRFSDDSNNNPLLTTAPHGCVPFVEVDHLHNPEIPLLATHMLLLEYEEMKKDIVSIVKKLAEFMGYPFNTEEERQGLVQKNGEQRPNSQFTIPNSVFFRKGEESSHTRDGRPHGSYY